MCTSSTSKPFFLKRPSSCATQAPLMLLAKEVQATRAFIWHQPAAGFNIDRIAMANTMMPDFICSPRFDNFSVSLPLNSTIFTKRSSLFRESAFARSASPVIEFAGRTTRPNLPNSLEASI